MPGNIDLLFEPSLLPRCCLRCGSSRTLTRAPIRVSTHFANRCRDAACGDLPATPALRQVQSPRLRESWCGNQGPALLRPTPARMLVVLVGAYGVLHLVFHRNLVSLLDRRSDLLGAFADNAASWTVQARGSSGRPLLSRSPLPLSGRRWHGSGQKKGKTTWTSPRSRTQQNGRQGFTPKRLAGEWEVFQEGFCSRVPAVCTTSTTPRDNRTAGQARERHVWR